MTPATQTELYVHRGGITRPKDPIARDGWVRWSTLWDGDAPLSPVDELLPDYCALASATGDDAAAFVAKWGVPELEGGQADATGMPQSLPVARLYEHALAVAAARRIGDALASKQLGDSADWRHVAYLLNPLKRKGQMSPQMSQELGTSWQLEREHFGALLTDAMRGAGVGTVANWVDQDRLTLTPGAQGLVGVVMLLLAREVGSGRQYTCSSCSAPVIRRRPPQPGERVYCSEPQCKREQRRRNQAAWRARKAGK